MEALTGNNLLVALLVAVALMELLNLIDKTVGVVKGWRKPAATVEERLDAHDVKLANDHKRINDLADGQRVVCKALKALLSHEINGNSVDKLRDAQTDIDDYLLSR